VLLMSDYIRDVKASRSKFRPLPCMLGLSLEHLASFTITGIHHIHALSQLLLFLMAPQERLRWESQYVGKIVKWKTNV